MDDKSEIRSRRSSAVSSEKTGTKSTSSNQQQSAKSPRTSRGRLNKIYRTPPTPPLQERLEMEKSFILDNNAVSSISSDYSKAKPKLGPVIPPYNSQKDKHVQNYFTYHGVNGTMDKNEQTLGAGTSIEGPVMDKFHVSGAGFKYISLRNQFGAGHSREFVDGHSQFMEGIRPIVGYNGKFGFRRTTPWLRRMPSPFGTSTLSSTH